MTKITYIYHGEEKIIDTDPRLSVSKNAVQNHLYFSSVETCKGKAECGLCKVKGIKGNQTARTRKEDHLLSGEDSHIRLGCQVFPVEGMIVEIPMPDGRFLTDLDAELKSRYQ